MPLPLLTDRLGIRAYDPDDATQMHEVLYRDPVAMRYVGGPRTFAETTQQVRGYAEDHVRRGYACWVVEERETGLIVGEAGLHPFDSKGPEIELAYAFGRPFWGRGFATEAARAIVAEGFGDLGLEEIVAVARDENTASLHVLENLGFVQDGRRFAWGHDHPFFRLRRS
ncbi:MAG: GNAT family N-acetyltransferase [Solirubrobacteraceae bacterium]|nr:GNAT family N-acetyltransferase [Solirubrobacteraceae bacterium]